MASGSLRHILTILQKFIGSTREHREQKLFPEYIKYNCGVKILVHIPQFRRDHVGELIQDQSML